MENQHRKITGYRELNQEEIDLMNEVKALEQTNLDLVAKIDAYNNKLCNSGTNADKAKVMDAEAYRWGIMAKTEIETAMMKLTRAVAKPVFYKPK